MNNKVKLFLIALVIFIILWFILKKKKTGGDDQNQSGGNQSEHLLLVQGSSGALVKKLQLKLNDLIRAATKNNVSLWCTYGAGMAPELVGVLNPDGIFGPRTACALKAITGRMSIYGDEIDSLMIDFTPNATILDHVPVGGL